MSSNANAEQSQSPSRGSTPEERIELAAQARLESIQAEKAKAGGTPARNTSLSALGWISAIGFAITVVAMIVVGTATSPGPLAMLFWPAMLSVGPTVGFLALVAYLATKAIITSRQSA